MDNIILTTGGTGGHIFPALAVAEELRRRNPNASLLFVGSLYGPEERLMRQAGIPFEGLPVRGLLGRGFKAVGAGAQMALAVGKAVGILRRFKPDVVAGFGGYAAFAPMLAARILGVPGVLHEQNAIAGASNRFLARLARRVCISLPNTSGFDMKKCVFTGNPVRAAVSAVGQVDRHRQTRRLLVMGGSQGAHALNAFMLENLAEFRGAGVEIRHQTGITDEGSVRAAYVAAGYAPECVSAFIDDMAGAYAWADVTLCRAGASTVAELCAAGLPSVLVPFPYAIHDHQTRNAEVLTRSGAAVLVPEGRMAVQHMSDILLRLLTMPGEREPMTAAALAAARPDAAARVVAVLEQTA
ncbi:undecaprenyldiphospho-muramoylpentapeptide beta-N-acetylglucosaminyltransferase [Desulfovibrio desulfuricans]|uniref:undecaprenyldiphospho-muramoylpentapeptide beta-N-acetylglucosaminyltransferase n=1 Tax=Desulfovibrio desulfuricans TaxID=876 RepID=UPI001AE2D248|nr:undecaprenyldiphospho-muramoylpentapeptide beta-N-acetylglucosaminyltransferase [Desulfovibrio desulfuricans]QTO41588.1 undecaprenyldiphospho-muramoylpentapeptide beta-N-acetylglucosaminyltransferase [Desulfovibrio desulfuricans]